MASGYSDLSEIRKGDRTRGSYSKPPKINLLDEKPRRESLVEQQLTTTIVRPSFGAYQFNIDSGHQQQVGTTSTQSPQNHSLYEQPSSYNTGQQYQRSHESPSPYNSTSTKTSYALVDNNSGYIQTQPGSSRGDSFSQKNMFPIGSKTVTTTTTTIRNTSDMSMPLKYQQQQLFQPRQYAVSYTELEADLVEKEEKLKREIAYLNQHQSPWSRPRQIREPRKEAAAKIRKDSKWVKEYPTASAPSSRPTSRASSTRSNTEQELIEKAAKLLQDAEEIERKQLNTQQILVESGASSVRRGQPSRSPSHENVGSVHTAIIKVPKGEINNKSPLPFAYDNFSTLGVRGNIASVGAAEPESPYPPIFPMIKKTPSPTPRHRV